MFAGISAVRVVRVFRYPLGDKLIFPSDDEEIFVSSYVEGYRTVPDVVSGFFKEHPKEAYCEHICWIWSLRGGVKTGFYVRQKNQRWQVLNCLDAYFSSLEALVGKEAQVSKVFPDFPRNENFGAFNIPETSSYLKFESSRAGNVEVFLVGNDFMIHHRVGEISYTVK